MNSPDRQWQVGDAHRVTRRLIVVMAAVMIAASLAVAYSTLSAFNHMLSPELEAKAKLIGHIVSADMRRALGYGIPLDDVYGADTYLDEIIDDHAELSYVAVFDANGTSLYRGGAARPFVDAIDHSVPLVVEGTTRGAVHVGINRSFVQRQLDDIFFDIVVILIAAVLVTLEILLALVLVYGTGPIQQLHHLLDQQARGDFTHVLTMRGRDVVGKAARQLSECARALHAAFHDVRIRSNEGPALLNDVGARFGLGAADGPRPLRQAGASDVRIPLFLFAFAEELQKSFLPLFVRDVYEPVPWLDDTVLIGLPIAVYLLVLAVAAPFAGGWALRYGSRRLFLLGLIPAVGGYLGCAVAGSVGELVVWRGVTALGYAMITIACQDYVIASSPDGRWGRNLVILVGVIMSATMCGTAIGGILADRMGYNAVFVLAAVFAMVAGAVAASVLSDETTSTEVRSGPGRLRAALVVAANFRFVIFLLCIAVPANILVAAYLWYLAPLYLSDLGSNASEIARVVMAYYLLMVIMGPLASRLADRPVRLAWVVGACSFVSAAGLIVFHDWQSIWAVVIAVGVLGLTHGLAKGAQTPLALMICSHEIETVGRNAVLGSLRFLERMGSMVGLLLAAQLIGSFGYGPVIFALGLFTSSAAVLFLLVHFVGRGERRAGL